MTATSAEPANGLQPPIGLLGGTFDPVHNGHLRLAIELRQMLGLARVHLIPSARPPHRNPPVASPGQRAKWIRVALADEDGLCLDDRELLRDGPSYTVDTLADLRRELPDTPLCLIMGGDVFAKLPEWQDWQQLFDYAHIVLIQRPGVREDFPAAAEQELQRRDADVTTLHRQRHGGIHVCQPPPLDISGTRVRALLAAGRSARFLLPDSVYEDVTRTRIYRQPEAS